MPKHIYNLKKIDKYDIELVGDKAAHLGEIAKNDINIPFGFVITGNAYKEFLIENNLQTKAKHLLSTVNLENPDSVRQISTLLRKYFRDSELPNDFKMDLFNNYKRMANFGKENHVLISHSNKSNSFNSTEAKGEASLINTIKELWANNFAEINLINHYHTYTDSNPIVVQEIIHPKKSGKLYTTDPLTLDKNKIVIKAVHGIYDDSHINYVNSPDYYEFDKKDHSQISKEVFPQLKMIKKSGFSHKVHDVPGHLQKAHTLLPNELSDLLINAKKIEKLKYFPQEIDWRINNDKSYFVNISPLTRIN